MLKLYLNKKLQWLSITNLQYFIASVVQIIFSFQLKISSQIKSPDLFIFCQFFSSAMFVYFAFNK